MKLKIEVFLVSSQLYRFLDLADAIPKYIFQIKKNFAQLCRGGKACIRVRVLSEMKFFFWLQSARLRTHALYPSYSITTITTVNCCGNGRNTALISVFESTFRFYDRNMWYFTYLYTLPTAKILIGKNVKKIVGAVWKLPDKQHSQSSQFLPKLGWIGCAIQQTTSQDFFSLILQFSF